jgi:hypothetical protein
MVTVVGLTAALVHPQGSTTKSGVWRQWLISSLHIQVSGLCIRGIIGLLTVGNAQR